MSKHLQFAIFLVSFLAVYGAMNVIAIGSLGAMLDVSIAIVAPLIFWGTISFPVTLTIEKKFPNIITRILYTLAGIWMGMVFYMTMLTLGYHVLALALPLDPVKSAYAILLITALISGYAINNARHIAIKRITIPNSRKRLRIAQLSDVHIGTIRNSAFLRHVIEKTNSTNPDIIVITGDLVDGSAPLQPHMFDLLNTLNAPTFFVSGNHEGYEGMARVENMLRGTDIRVLDNEAVLVKGVQIVGVKFDLRRSREISAIGHIPLDPKKDTILLHHMPIGMHIAERAGVHLQLSGHTHAGQIAPFGAFVKLFYPYLRGLYRYGNMHLYVSAGTGTWGPYMRIGSENEITLIELEKAKN